MQTKPDSFWGIPDRYISEIQKDTPGHSPPPIRNNNDISASMAEINRFPTPMSFGSVPATPTAQYRWVDEVNEFANKSGTYIPTNGGTNSVRLTDDPFMAPVGRSAYDYSSPFQRSIYDSNIGRPTSAMGMGYEGRPSRDRLASISSLFTTNSVDIGNPVVPSSPTASFQNVPKNRKCAHPGYIPDHQFGPTAASIARKSGAEAALPTFTKL